MWPDVGRHPKQRSTILDATGERPSFGATLRGARLGWRWSPKHRGFVRLSVNGDKAVVQLYPNALMPSPRGRSDSEYVVWWEEPGLLDCIAELRNVRRVKRPIYFEVPLSREIEA